MGYSSESQKLGSESAVLSLGVGLLEWFVNSRQLTGVGWGRLHLGEGGTYQGAGDTRLQVCRGREGTGFSGWWMLAGVKGEVVVLPLPSSLS